MDNILKLVFGCLALVGLIVMIIPNSDPLAKHTDGQVLPPANPAAPAEQAIVVPPPPPPGQPAKPATGNTDANGFAVQDFDIQNFGQPMVDPTPPSERKRQADAANAAQQNMQPAPQQMPAQGMDSGGPMQPAMGSTDQ